MAIVQDEKKKKASPLDILFSWKYLDKITFFAIIILLMFSIVFVYSSSVYDSINSSSAIPESPYGTAMRQVLFAIVGLIIYFVITKIPTKLYNKMLLPIVIIVILLMLCPFLFEARNGAYRWIPLGVFTLQPAEIAKLTVILIWSQALSTRVKDFKVRWNYLRKKNAPIERLVKRLWISWRQPVILTLILFVLFRMQSDNGSLIISLGLVFTMIFASGVLPEVWNKAFFGFLILGVVAVAGIYIYVGNLDESVLAELGDKTSEYNYILGRFVAWVDPFLTYSGAGYQSSNSLIAIANGGFFGRGIGNGLQKQGFLSEGHNDFIIANIVEEIGIFGVSIIYILYLTIISMGYKISRESKNTFSSLVAFGITTLFFFQAFWNSGGIIGLLPLKGLTAPLLSYGGTSLIITLFSLAVLQRINIENRKRQEKLRQRKEANAN